uniref:Dual serine/threonine and tyrosine protein kinase n=1 Tax=Saccoglossus kowalevskii TaxID=10224 RepID=A0ABM0M8Q5_SACKO|nr:PREDICTED: dual serine/threonine and tyrosine protein kinase-like [Saccoglossus kowalevskii]
MAANLPSEFSKFERYRRQIGDIFDETKTAFGEIIASGQFEPGQISFIEIPENEDECVNNTLEKPPCILVLGQTCYAKLVVVNELLGDQVLPQVDSGYKTGSCRMVRIRYGIKNHLSFMLPDSFELVDEHLHIYKSEWTTVPKEEMEIQGDVQFDPYLRSAVLEVCISHTLLQEGAQLVVSPCNCIGQNIIQVYQKCCEGVLPIVIYALENNCLTDKEVQELRNFEAPLPNIGVTELTESAKHCLKYNPVQENTQCNGCPEGVNNECDSNDSDERPITIREQLHELGYLSHEASKKPFYKNLQVLSVTVDSELVTNFDNFSTVLLYVRHVLQSHLVTAASILNNAHQRCLKMFITTAFDMARDMMITPRRVRYAKEKEIFLYESLLEIASQKQEELKDLIIHTVLSMKEDLLEEASNFIFVGVDIPESGEITQSKDIKQCTHQIQDLVLSRLNSAVAGKLIGSVNCLRDSYIGTLSRCLESLERGEVELEPSASLALQQILNAAYQVEVNVNTSSSIVRIILEKMKQVIRSMPWSNPPKVDAEWKKKVALDMMNSLSEYKLAKNICSQFKTRLCSSHEAFNQSMNNLEAKHSGRLEKTEEQRMRVRKIHAPKLARLSLESTSMQDIILHGMPQMGREIGRGQYGVVYACDSWGGHSPCALKSVVPPDEKHWNDLALEFHYTRSINDHDRIVTLRGSIIDNSYGNGTSPAVLLIMDRLQRDLYVGIKMGLDTVSRMQIAMDVVEGIRYLHSQGLVHRDIKLKNVLLDKQNRGKITDLGFCKPEAMMSGSIVGTPIHMAPELFTGRYDNSVDVYAFGILFWYICAGHIRLPLAFEQCASKDHLWNSVRRGVRPERLIHFDEECWTLMNTCWSGEPGQRPLLGEVHTALSKIFEKAKKNPSKPLYHGHAQTHTRVSDKKYRLT